MTDDAQQPPLVPTELYGEEVIQRARDLLDAPPESIGPYRILERIGGGGMGEVFRAEQRAPIRREVALKFIKLGMDTKAVIARFEAERQALALMDHPHIAKVFDAGADDTGRPYFVMEYVKGKPITDYSDANRLTIPERLELFEQVCQAIQHAHHKGIIHRDLKPGNVLVSTQDGKPFAKVIDFGIAKAISQQLTDKTLFTRHDQFVGTPQYMSPEQAEGSLDIDTRTDVYSMGVLLYELLTGSPPFSSTELKLAAFEHLKKLIREVDPPKPSTRLAVSEPTLPTLAAFRRTEPKRLGLLVRGELDWIVMKALDKDRKRRYQTPLDLAHDLSAHVSGEPVQAAPPSTAYRLRKFARRHKRTVSTLAAVMVVLLLGMVSTAIQAVRAHRAESAIKASESELLGNYDALRTAFAEVAAELWFDDPAKPEYDGMTFQGKFALGDGRVGLYIESANGKRTVTPYISPDVDRKESMNLLLDFLRETSLAAMHEKDRLYDDASAARDQALLAKQESEQTNAHLAEFSGRLQAGIERWYAEGNRDALREGGFDLLGSRSTATFPGGMKVDLSFDGDNVTTRSYIDAGVDPVKARLEFAEYVSSELLSSYRQGRELQQTLLESRDQAERHLVKSLLRPIGYTFDPLSDAERSSFIEWSQIADPRVKLLALEVALSDPELAMRVARRADYVIQAAVGLSPSQRAKAIDLVLAKQRLQEADARIHVAACWLALALGDSDPPALEDTIQYLYSYDLSDDLNYLLHSLEAWAPAVDGNIARRIAGTLGHLTLHDTTHDEGHEDVRDLAFVYLASHSHYLTPEDRRSLADVLVSMLSESSYRHDYGNMLAALLVDLPTDERTLLMHSCISVVQSTVPQSWSAFGELVRLFAPYLDETTRAALCPQLLSQLLQSHEFDLERERIARGLVESRTRLSSLEARELLLNLVNTRSGLNPVELSGYSTKDYVQFAARFANNRDISSCLQAAVSQITDNRDGQVCLAGIMAIDGLAPYLNNVEWWKSWQTIAAFRDEDGLAFDLDLASEDAMLALTACCPHGKEKAAWNYWMPRYSEARGWTVPPINRSPSACTAVVSRIDSRDVVIASELWREVAKPGPHLSVRIDAIECLQLVASQLPDSERSRLAVDALQLARDENDVVVSAEVAKLLFECRERMSEALRAGCCDMAIDRIQDGIRKGERYDWDAWQRVLVAMADAVPSSEREQLQMDVLRKSLLDQEYQRDPLTPEMVAVGMPNSSEWMQLLKHPFCVGEFREWLLARTEEEVLIYGEPVFLEEMEIGPASALRTVNSCPERRFHNQFDAAAWIAEHWPDFDLESSYPVVE